MASVEDLKKRIEKHFKNKAKVVVESKKENNSHFKVEVRYNGFKNLSLVQQHKEVYKAINEKFHKCGSSNLHALEISTKII